MNNDQSGELIQRYFLGTISEDEMVELDRRLKDDEGLRAQFAAAARLDTNLRDAASSFSQANDEPKIVSIRASRNVLVGLGAAAVLLLCAVLFLQFRPGSSLEANRRSPEPIARIAELNGTVAWIGDGRQEEERPAVGDELTGGTLEVSSLDSWAEVVFDDGSSVWVSGPAVLTLSDGESGKLIRLREGDLSLDVSPQPPGKPMRVITPSAEAVVLGTQFNISVNSFSTSIAVNEGRVRVTRLVDGSVQEVEADHRVVAALEQESQFKAHPRGEHVRIWKSEFPRDARKGKWKPGAGGRPDALQAKAHLFRGDDHGEEIEPILLHSVVVGPSGGAHPPVLLTEGARFRIRGKLRRSYRVGFGFGTRQARGGFSGKFATKREIEIDQNAEGHFELELFLDDFTRKRNRFPSSPVGHELGWFWIQTLQKDVGLEVSSVELISPESSSNR
jgi:ferric-dicitrate binding protein FerR (iron transport regulator)